MQAATLPITAGWLWIHNGWRLFMRQPLAMFFWSLLTGFLINTSYIFPIVGQVVLITATPLLTFITLSACRTIAQGRRMTPGAWLQPIRSQPDVRRRLLKLGVAYLAFCLTAGFMATLPFLSDLTAAIDADGELSEAALMSAMRGPFITFGLLYVAISALFWHAPALTGWHGIRTTRALFYSMVACWRNKLAFLAYGASWAAIFMGLQAVVSTLQSMGLSATSAQTFLMPVNLGVAAVLYCSFYPAYISVFGANYPTASIADSEESDPADGDDPQDDLPDDRSE